MRPRIGDELPVAHRFVSDSQFEHAVKDHSPASGAVSVEPKTR